MMDIMNTILGVVNAVNTVSTVLGSNEDKNNQQRVEVIEKEIVRPNPINQAPINLTININVYKDGKLTRNSIGSGLQQDQLSITQREDSIDFDLN